MLPITLRYTLTAALLLLPMIRTSGAELSWRTQTLGSTGMTADLPGVPTTGPSTDLGTTFQQRFTIKLPNVEITFFSTTATSGDYSLDGGVKGVIRRFEELAAKKGGSVTTSSAAQVKRGSRTGRTITGVMTAGDSRIRFHLVLLAEGPQAWSVLAVHNDGDAEAQAIAVRVLKSFAVTP
jgi:hypothetical protein